MELFLWLGFIVLILGLLALDLGVFHRRARAPSLTEALAWSAFWISLALAFTGVVYFIYEHNWIGAGLASRDLRGVDAALLFVTGYLVEESLSLDNIFVIALIFSYFRIPLAYQHRVLFWGIMGALVMRGMMIAAGAVLIERFTWMTYVFGGLLLVTAARMLVVSHENIDPEQSPAVRLARRLYPVTDGLRGERFLVNENGRRAITPLFLVLVMVESTDLLFAIDSVPAIFAVTSDPFLVYTSNVFAILGLRSLYFALAPLLGHFRFLKTSLVFVLAFVGVKMLLAHHQPISVVVSLAVILGTLGVGIVASVMFPTAQALEDRSPVEEEMEGLPGVTVTRAVRSIILVMGGTILFLATTWLALPGPDMLTLVAAFVLLGTQAVWAWQLVARTRARVRAWEEARRSRED